MGILNLIYNKLFRSGQFQTNQYTNDGISQPPKNSHDQQDLIYPQVTLNSEPISQQPQIQSPDNMEHPQQQQNAAPMQEGQAGGLSQPAPHPDMNPTNLEENNNVLLNPAQVSSYNEKIGMRMRKLGINYVDKEKFLVYYNNIRIEAAQKGVPISSLLED